MATMFRPRPDDEHLVAKDGGPQRCARCHRPLGSYDLIVGEGAVCPIPTRGCP